MARAEKVPIPDDLGFPIDERWIRAYAHTEIPEVSSDVIDDAEVLSLTMPPHRQRAVYDSFVAFATQDGEQLAGPVNVISCTHQCKCGEWLKGNYERMTLTGRHERWPEHLFGGSFLVFVKYCHKCRRLLWATIGEVETIRSYRDLIPQSFLEDQHG